VRKKKRERKGEASFRVDGAAAPIGRGREETSGAVLCKRKSADYRERTMTDGGESSNRMNPRGRTHRSVLKQKKKEGSS